jgi:hypothetical protein
MPAVKDLNRTAAKWTRVTAGAAGEYREGVEHPKKDWETETKAAEGRYEQALQASINDKRFGKGVSKAGTGKWQRNASELGPDRFAQGVRASADNYARGFGPYRDVIERTELPQRGPKGDPANIDRVRVLAEALHNEKLARLGA